MQTLPITLHATESNWRLFVVRKADPAFRTFFEKVLQRDQHTCQYCGFRALQGLEVVNRDQDYHNNRLNNLATACPFCTQCFFLEAVGKSEFGGGSLIHFPQMTQNELNAWCHVLFAAIVNGYSYAIQAKNIYRALRLRSQWVEKKLGEGFSNPSLYGRVWVDAPVNTQMDSFKESLASQVRLLPELTRFVEVVKNWSVAATEELMK